MQIISIMKHTLMIVFFLFVMMLLVDFFDLITKRQISNIIQGGKWRRYSLASFLGATPGCLGAFMDVTLYVHGMISFGALVGGMIATSGDEAFVMISQFPLTAVALFSLLFIFGILFAWISDIIIPHLGFATSEACTEDRCEECLPLVNIREKSHEHSQPINLNDNYRFFSPIRVLILVLAISFLILVSLGFLGPPDWNWQRITSISLSICIILVVTSCSEHYLKSHIWQHIIKKHMFRIFLWSFGALLFLHYGLSFWDMDTFIRNHLLWVLLIAALMGVIPESGPHLIFVMMYAHGMISFSVLLTSSFVQDGHGMLPMLSHNLKDFMLIKIMNLVFGLIVGGAFFILGF